MKSLIHSFGVKHSEKWFALLRRRTKSLSSNRPKLTAGLLPFCDVLIEEPMLYLFDNQSLLKTVNSWIGKGGMTTLVGAPNADILFVSIEILQRRITARTGTLSLHSLSK